MEEYKFSNSNLDFNELFAKYKTLNTTYSDSDIVDFKINIYENCNLLQDLTTTFPVPSTNIRLSSFKNNYIIADIQTLDLNQAFYTANTALFTTEETGNYINNINLTNIITTYFNYTNDDIYPSKKIIIKINLHKEIVDTNGSGALQINMKEIKEHFHSLFDTLELDIDQYVTGKHGELEATNLQPSGTTGGKGQVAILNSAGPAINITNNDDPSSYFKLDIRTNGRVSGGFGASGGNGGNGKINETEFERTDTHQNGPRYSIEDLLYISVFNVLKYSLPQKYYWQHTTAFYWGLKVKEIDSGTTPIGSTTAYSQNSTPPTVSPATFPESSEFESYYDDDTNTYLKRTRQYVKGTLKYELTVGSDGVYTTRYSIGKYEYTYTKTGVIAPTRGNAGSKANYSNNADTPFPSRNGDTGTAHNGTGGAGGAKGIQGGITNITATTATNITIIDS